MEDALVSSAAELPQHVLQACVRVCVPQLDLCDQLAQSAMMCREQGLENSASRRPPNPKQEVPTDERYSKGPVNQGNTYGTIHG